jgi:hypothetical protein
MVSECARDGSPRYWAARARHRKMWNEAGDILWIVVGDQVASAARRLSTERGVRANGRR